MKSKKGGGGEPPRKFKFPQGRDFCPLVSPTTHLVYSRCSINQCDSVKQLAKSTCNHQIKTAILEEFVIRNVVTDASKQQQGQLFNLF